MQSFSLLLGQALPKGLFDPASTVYWQADTDIELRYIPTFSGSRGRGRDCSPDG